ncbi:MAG TPA: thiamine pyrophosphate-binding protein [Pseudonocardiaceae bacterium]
MTEFNRRNVLKVAAGLAAVGGATAVGGGALLAEPAQAATTVPVGSPGSGSTSTIGEFLLRRLKEAGIAHAFGVPGDYNLEFMQQIDDTQDITWVGTCNELNASYAADGYARLNGLGAVIVTNGVGALSAINGIGGAYAEHVPVICIVGSLPLVALEQNRLMHHTLADGGRDEFLRAFAQVTAAQAQLTPQNAAAEIDRVILAAWQLKLPVYLELPSDVAYLDIHVPTDPLRLTPPPSDNERLASASKAIVARFNAAKTPAVLVDLDTARFGVAPEITQLAQKLSMPIACVNTAKAVIDETLPNYIGMYTGAGSNPAVRTAIESSDCLLTIGYRRVDTTSGYFSDNLPASTISASGYAVEVDGVNYQAVTLKDLLDAVIGAVNPVSGRTIPRAAAAPAAPKPAASSPLTQAAMWQAVQGFVQKGDVIIAEDGTSEAGGWGLSLPSGCTFITQAVWGSIGYTVGSLLGTLFAAPSRRHLLCVGDGSFQLTAQELSTMLRHDLKPVILLVNNGGYTIERAILGKNAPYNDVANWSYAQLAQVFRPGSNALSVRVQTVGDFQNALNTNHDGLMFIEAVLGPDDASAGLIAAGHVQANLDYGPRGPQTRPGIQL